MVLFQEPKITQKDEPEKSFCETIIKVINEICEQKKINSYFKHYFIIKNFGLDIALFIKNSDNSYKIKFFEIKAFVGSRQGGVGFGNRYGRGPQVDILHRDDSSIDIANNFIRWVFVDGTKPEGTERYIICNNSQAKNAAMGGVRNNKQNNFRMNELLKNAISWGPCQDSFAIWPSQSLHFKPQLAA